MMKAMKIRRRDRWPFKEKVITVRRSLMSHMCWLNQRILFFFDMNAGVLITWPTLIIESAWFFCFGLHQADGTVWQRKFNQPEKSRKRRAAERRRRDGENLHTTFTLKRRECCWSRQPKKEVNEPETCCMPAFLHFKFHSFFKSIIFSSRWRMVQSRTAKPAWRLSFITPLQWKKKTYTLHWRGKISGL